MDQLLDQKSKLTTSQPRGEIQLLEEDARPLLLISAGTGISQALSLALSQTIRHPHVDVYLLVCSDQSEDFYYLDLLPESRCFQSKLIADPTRSVENQGLIWLRDQIDNFAVETRVVICGGPAFVYAVTDTLMTAGLQDSRLESDVYAYAPR